MHDFTPEIDIQANNVLFIGGTGTKTIEEHLHDSPQKIHGEFKLKGSCYPIMQSQPIPSSFLWSDPGITVELYILYLADFGCGKQYPFGQYRSPVHRLA